MIKYSTLIVCILFIWNPFFAEADPGKRIPGEVIIQIRQGASIQGVLTQVNQQLENSGRLILEKQLGIRNAIFLCSYNEELLQAVDVKNLLSLQKEVLNIQDNYLVTFRTDPNDPRYGDQWGIARIGADRVWDLSTGGITITGDTIVVAILDSGFDIQHEDIASNLWVNKAEIPDDGLDNDGNALIDDYYGWNYVNESDEHPVASHGLSVAGLIGAKGNNGVGVTGVNWNVKLMLFSIKRIDEIVSAYEYIIDQRARYNESNGAEGAFVVATNASFGVENLFCSDQPVWGGMYDLLGEVGVLTGAGTSNANVNVEEVGDMPTTCTSDYLLTVTNTNEEDVKHPGSAYGKISIDIGSPGDRSFTTKPNDSYGLFGGNSAAAPHLTGAIALLYSMPCAIFTENMLIDPAGTALIVRQAIINGVDPITDLEGNTVTGGRLNVFNSMNLIQEECGGTVGDLEIIKVYPNPVSSQLTIEYQSPDFEDTDLVVYNMLGQIVYTNTFIPSRFSTKKQIINVQNWADGTYFMKLQKGDTFITETFVKMN